MIKLKLKIEIALTLMNVKYKNSQTGANMGFR